MIPTLPTRYQGAFVAATTLVLCLPLASGLITQQSVLKERAGAKAAIALQNSEDLETTARQADQDTKLGLERVKTCMVIDPLTPLGVNSAPVRYRGTKTLLPVGTPICDVNGFTGIQGSDRVTDIRPIETSKLNQALGARKAL